MWFDKFLLCFRSISAGPLEDSVCGLIGAGMAASCLHSIIPSRGTSGFSSCLRGACSRREKLFRGPSSSPLLPLAAAAPQPSSQPSHASTPCEHRTVSGTQDSPGGVKMLEMFLHFPGKSQAGCSSASSVAFAALLEKGEERKGGARSGAKLNTGLRGPPWLKQRLQGGGSQEAAPIDVAILLQASAYTFPLLSACAGAGTCVSEAARGLMGCKEQGSSLRTVPVPTGSGCSPGTAKPRASSAPAAPPKHPSSKQFYKKPSLPGSLTFSLINQLCY
ncbi:uncharacterized protein LOC128154231 [Harpia harpyja]|uniref:uncharacterized protein LOC128154231 n=1 Tax=Harpia harpyja TaxID=202280 RepID=UPI0022B14840|nr:uncharacterized protein LOC128154231 [Harpia harpyja]